MVVQRASSLATDRSHIEETMHIFKKQETHLPKGATLNELNVLELASPLVQDAGGKKYNIQVTSLIKSQGRL